MKSLFIFCISAFILSGCIKQNTWVYSEKKDEVRNIKVYLASLKSDHDDLEIVIEYPAQEPPTIRLNLSDKTYSCNDFCYAFIKFDNHDPESVKLSKVSDQVVVIQDKDVARKITESLTRAKNTIIEVPLKGSNKQQLKFSSPSLKLEEYSYEEIKKAKSKGGDALSEFVKMWDDKYQLVYSTPRIFLVPIVSELQELKKDIEEIEVSDCLLPAKEAHKKYMEARLATTTNFVRNGVNTPSTPELIEGDESILTYARIYSDCTNP